MGIMLEPYDGSSRDEMVALIEQDNPYMACQRESRFYDQALDVILEGEGVLYRIIRDAESGEFLGECDIHDMYDPEWEMSMKLVKTHVGEGVGYAALVDFLAEMKGSYGKDHLIAKVMPDNEACIGLLLKVGARPVRIELSELMPDESMAERFRRAYPELVDDTAREMAELFSVEPRSLLGRVLVFDVPTVQAAPSVLKPHLSRKAQGDACVSSPIEGKMRAFIMNELFGIFEALRLERASGERAHGRSTIALSRPAGDAS